MTKPGQMSSDVATLERNQERYAVVAQAATEGLYDWDMETEELYVSPRLNEMFDFGQPPSSGFAQACVPIACAR